MKKLIYIVILLLFCYGCSDNDNTIPNVLEKNSEDISPNSNTLTNEAEKEIEKEINIYINDKEFILQVVYKGNRTRNVNGIGDFNNNISAKPVMDFLGISYQINEDLKEIIFDSAEYGVKNITYTSEVEYVNGDIYIDFDLIKTYTHGYFYQDDYDYSIYFYTYKYKHPNVPTSLEGCYKILDKKLTEEEKKRLKNSDQGYRVTKLGEIETWIHVFWLSSYDSEVYDLLYRGGIILDEDMSGIILEGYYLYLNNEPSSLSDIIKWCSSE